MSFQKGQSIRPKPGHDIYRVDGQKSRYVVLGQCREWFSGDWYTNLHQVEPKLGAFFTMESALLDEWFEEVGNEG
jgi:hypothetical protein